MKYDVAILLPIHKISDEMLVRSISSINNQCNLPENLNSVILAVVANAVTEEEKEHYSHIICDNITKNGKFEVTMCLEPEKGIVPALNASIRLMNTWTAPKLAKYIFRQDADDFWYPTKMSKQLEFLESNPGVDILGTSIRFVDKDLNPKETLIYPENDNEIKGHILLGQNAIAHPSVAFRSNVLKYTGGYNDTFPFAEDLDLWLRCIKRHKFHNLQEVLVDYTQCPNPEYNPLSPQIAASNATLALRYFR
jgi:hypothetical protein